MLVDNHPRVLQRPVSLYICFLLFSCHVFALCMDVVTIQNGRREYFRVFFFFFEFLLYCCVREKKRKNYIKNDEGNGWRTSTEPILMSDAKANNGRVC